MDLHGIDVSVSWDILHLALPLGPLLISNPILFLVPEQQIVSLANPWLDFLEPDEAIATAAALNADLESYCATYDPASSPSTIGSQFSALTAKRLFGFGSLPLVPGVPVDAVVQ